MDNIELIVRQMERIHDKLDRFADAITIIEGKLDNVHERQTKAEDASERIKEDVSRVEQKLDQEHTRRANLLEEKTDKLETYVIAEKSKESYKAKLAKRVSLIVGILVGVASFGWTLIQFFDFVVTKFKLL